MTRHLLTLTAFIWVGSALAAPPSVVRQRLLDLRSETPLVRRHAAIALGTLGDRTAGAGLIKALTDSDVGVRREAAKALAAIRDPKTVGALIKALKDADTNVRFNAAYALGEIKDRAAAPALLEALGDSDWGVRDQSAWALRELRDPSLAASLTAALKRANADTAHILWILRRMPGEVAIPAIAALLGEERIDLRKLALSVLADIGTPAVVEHVIRTLDDEDKGIRLSAIAALREIRDERVIPALRKRLGVEPDASVREAVEKAIFELSRHPDLVAHWSFDDQDATVAKDLAGKDNHGKIEGCKPVPGRVGHALRFVDGAFIELGRPAGLPIGGTELTFSAWVKSEAPNGVVVARGGAFCGFSLYLKDGVAKFGIHRTQEGPAFIAAGTEQVGNGWVHLAGMVKETSVEIYVNGKLAGKTKTPGYIPGNCGQGMEIGFDVANSSCEICDAFQGIIDEVKAFRAALSAEDLAKECQVSK